ncbi:MFS transporter [Roseateles amylovorans]|uniref:MFS transporter n=1 Tax=Roseateles amylovorans TaxID=2978473 RepID=A0ABY6AU37_9BURK|nr:MFS transporter [Roseateles amylovorans]UXH76357.1 MFS transporter [Roseateles amylovorans]
MNTADGLRYGALGLPLAFLALPMTIALPQHYAQHHGVSLATLGAVLLIARLLDTVMDPWIGQRVDQGLAGPRRRLLIVALVAAIAIGGGFGALFFAPFGNFGPQTLAASPVPSDTSTAATSATAATAALAATSSSAVVPVIASASATGTPLALWLWLGLNLVLVYIGYSTLSVLHQAWGTRLGGDESQRTRVAAWREGFGLGGLLLAGVLPALLGFGVATTVLAVSLALGLALLWRVPFPAASGTEAHGSDGSAAAQAGSWRTPWRHGRFRALLAVYMFNGIGNAVAATLLAFFVQDRLQAVDGMPLFLGGYCLAAVVSLPLWMRVIQRVGLVRAWAGGMLASVAAFGAALALGTGDRTGFLLICLATGAALGADLAAPTALLTGLLQREGRTSQAATYAGWWTAATKLNLGLAAGLALPLLAAAGYAPGRRDDDALQALSLAYVLVPCLLKLLAVAALATWRSELVKEAS